jgi:hypothetical protein
VQAIAEQSRALSERDRVDEEVQFVDKAVGHQRAR